MSKDLNNLPKDKTLLVLDAACPNVFAGLWQDGQWLAMASIEVPALEGLFDAVDQCLKAADMSLEAITGFAHDEGPGSVLGIRVAAMAIKTWRALPSFREKPVFAFHSLAFAIEQVRRKQKPESDFCIISDYRKDAWLSIRSDKNEIEPLSEAEAEAIELPIFHSAQRRSWRPPPAAAKSITIDLASFPEIFANGDIIRPVDQPGLYAPFRTDYKRWTPDRHRATANPQ
ncbi:hypothetical protein [Rubellicoccus peritrichatus]|uniref:Gcp-like domain-containing protein n=1 Tax=Rubellicoccus peritrichatus TaxID=3080537 RepID=A0AAQ3L8F3_9BACT|nr:hypothetical protein [Puniceicoccus sp. CR14]WOO39834.1 hypothetical protein RZN69_14510 [Puniceicoccus sp. CR14]